MTDKPIPSTNHRIPLRIPSNAPDARNKAIAHKIAIKYGIILIATLKPPFAPSINDSYTLTFFRIARRINTEMILNITPPPTTTETASP